MKRMKNEADVESADIECCGPGFNSVSPERRRNAITEGLRKRKARWGAKSRKVADGVCVSWECCWQAVWCSEEWVGCEWYVAGR